MDDEGLTRQELLLEVRGLRQKLADTRRVHQTQVEALLAARQRAEAAGRELAEDLEKEQARLRAVLDLAPEAIAVADAQGRIILSNLKADLLYSRPVDSRAGSRPDADPCRSLLAGAALEGESCRHAELSLRPEGEWGEVLAHAGPVRDPQGRITGAVAVFQDISRWREIAGEHRRLQEEAQNQAEELEVANEELQVQSEELQVQNEELRAQTQILEAQKAELEAGRALLKSVLEQMPASVVVAAAPNGPILLDNPLADRIWDEPLQSIDDLEGFWRIPRYHPDGRPLRREEMPLWRSLNLGEHVMDEELILRSNGGPIHLSVSSAPVRDAQGRVVAGVVTHFDITARKQAEAALRTSKAQLYTVFENLNEGLVFASLDGRLFNWNQAAVAMHGFASLEECSRYLPEFAEIFELTTLDGAVLPLEQWPLARIFRGEQLRDQELRVRRLDSGWQRILNYSGALARDPKGQPLLAVVSVTDITDRKRAEEDLRASEERFRTMANAIPQLAWTADRDGYITWYNHRWYDYTGTTPEEMEGWGWQQVHDPEVLPKALARWRASIATGRPFDMVFPLRGADGQFRQFLTRVMPLKDADGQVIQWFGTNTDITERQQAEAALRRSEARFRSLVEANIVGFVVVDRENILEANDAFLRMVGYSREDLRAGLNWNEMTPPEYRHLDERAYQEILTKGEYSPFEKEFIRKNGKRVSILTGGTLLKAEPLQVVGLVLDITTRQQAENALRESQRDLNRAQAVAHIGSWRLNVRDNQLFWSDETCRIFGIAPGTSLTYESFLHAVHPDDREYVEQKWAAALRGEPYDLEHRIIVEDLVKWVREKAELELDSQGELVAAFGTAQDITELKRAEAALQRSTQRQDLLADTAGHLLASASPQQVVDSLCQKVMTFLDCDAFFNFLVDETAGRLHLNAWAGIPAAEAKKIEWLDLGVAVCGCAALEGCRIVTENIQTTPDPRTVLVKSYGIQAYACHPLIIEGRLLGTLSFGTRRRCRFSADDLALMKAVADQVAIAMDRKLAEEALRASEARERARAAELQAVLDAVPAIIMLAHDPEARLITGNQAAYELLRLPAGSNMSRTPFLEDERPAHFKIMKDGREVAPGELPVQRAAALGETIQDYEFDLAIADGGVQHLFGNAVPLRDDAGRPRGAVAAFVDITTRKQAEAALHRAHEELEETVQERTAALRLANEHLRQEIQVRRQTEEALGYERERLFAVLERIPAHVSLLRADHTFAFVNGEFIRRFGEPGPKRCYELMARQNPCEECQAMEVFQKGEPVIWEWSGPDGKDYQIFDYPFIDVDGSPLALEMGVDITARKQAEEQAVSTGRMYRMLSQVNETIVRTRDRNELCRHICRIMMAEGDFVLAWVGLLDPENRVVKAAVQYDLKDEYLQNLTIPLADVPEGHGPTGIAAREGRFDVCNDIAADPRMAPWRQEAMARGFRSSAAFPLRVASRVVGVLSVYAGRPEFFSQEEIALLESLAGNLSFALDFLDREARRRQAEEALRESEERLRYLASQLLDAQERERHRLALELHDDLGQSLMVLKMQVRAIEKVLPAEQWQTREQCTAALSYMNIIVDNVRRLSRDLRPAVLEDLGLPAALRLLLEEMQKYYGLELELDLDDLEGLLSRDEQVNIYRIFQESLTNIVKHARASRVHIAIKREAGGASVRVEDNGVGFDLAAVLARDAARQGLGLAALEERVRMLGSKLTITSRENQGTTLAFFVPVTGVSSES